MSTQDEQFFQGIDDLVEEHHFLEKVALPRYQKEAHDALDEIIELKQQLAESRANNHMSSTYMQLYIDKIRKTLQNSSVSKLKAEFAEKSEISIDEHTTKSKRRGSHKNK